MIKLSIKLKAGELLALDAALEKMLETDQDVRLNYGEKAILSLLQHWHLKKVKAKTIGLSNEGVQKIQIEPAVGYALLALLKYYDLRPATYTGHLLLRINAELDKTFR